MSTIRLPALGAAGALVFLIQQAALAAPEPKALGTFQQWTAFTYTEGKSKVCYLVGRPQASEPKDAKRDEVYVTVTHRPTDKVRNEVGVYVGYKLKDKSAVDASVGNAKFSLFTKDDSAWAPDAKTDKALTDALAAGQSLVIKGTSARGTATTDTYTLAGFAAALKAISGACP
jgi:invasion protein IalB